MIRILIADDHPVLRKGLIQLLRESYAVSGVLEAGDGNQVLPLLRDNEVDVLILDISLPGKDGLVVLGEVHHEFPHLPVLMLSIQPEDQYAARAFKLGAMGCLNKATAPEELVRAVKQLATGSTYLSDITGSILLNSLHGTKGAAPHLALSERETQVMLMIAAGKTPTEIAEELRLSVKTVSTYRHRLLEKLGLKNNSQLTQYVFKHKLMPLSL